MNDNPTGVDMAPKHMTRTEFARRIYRLMNAKGWHASELARQAGVPRDSISTYLRGRTLPQPITVAKLARALGVETEELLPNLIESAVLEDINPEFSMTSISGKKDAQWVRVNRMVSMSTAVKIAALLDADATNRK